MVRVLADRRIWLGVAVLVALLFAGRLTLRLIEVPGFLGIDTLSLVHAARAVVDGQPLYVDPTGERFFRATIAEYYGPPAYALVWTPLAYLDATLIRRLSVLVGVAGFGLVIWLITGRNRDAFVATAVGAMLSHAVDVAAAATASSVLIPVLLALAWRYLDRRPVLAGILLGVAAAFRLYPAAILLAFVVARRWRLLSAAGGALVAVTAVGILALGVEVTRQYAELAMSLLRADVLVATFSPAGIVHRIGGPGDLIRLVSLCGGLGLLILGGLRLRHEADHLGYGLAVVGMLLVPAQIWDHYLAVLVIPAAFLALRHPAYGLSLALLLPDLEGLGLIWMPALLLLEFRGAFVRDRQSIPVAA